MSIDKWSPLKELEDMRKDMDRLFDEFAKPSRRRVIWPKSEGLVMPSIELYNRTDDIVVKVELPGVRREDIDLTVTKGKGGRLFHRREDLWEFFTHHPAALRGRE
jgi:HSP20 family protein